MTLEKIRSPFWKLILMKRMSNKVKDFLVAVGMATPILVLASWATEWWLHRGD